MKNPPRKQIYIVYHSATRSVWKHLFFMKKDLALPTVKRFYGDSREWQRRSEDSTHNRQLGTFTVMPLKEYTKIADVEYTEVTKIIKGLDHR